MSRSRQARRRPNYLRLLLIFVFVFAAVYAGAYCIFRAPEQKQLPQQDPTQEAEDLSQDPAENSEEEPLRSHQERKAAFYTILVSGKDDDNGGSDTNILVAVDAENNYIHGVSIPRDTKSVVDGKHHKINYAFNRGGAELLAETVEELLGIPVDYTVTVDLKGFVALVDAIDGVTFDVPVDMDYEDPYQDLYIHIPKGVQTLNGENALKVVRFREGYATQDIGRMETQQKFLKAGAKQILTVDNLGRVDEFVKIFQTYVKTDLTLGNLAWLGKEAIGMGTDAISFSTLPGEWNFTTHYVDLNPEETLAVINQYLNPYVEDRVMEDLHIPAA